MPWRNGASGSRPEPCREVESLGLGFRLFGSCEKGHKLVARFATATRFLELNPKPYTLHPKPCREICNGVEPP
jgi:hypothetical protein